MKLADKAFFGRVSKSPGRNVSEPIGGLEKKEPRRPSFLNPGEGSRVLGRPSNTLDTSLIIEKVRSEGEGVYEQSETLVRAT